MEELRKGYQDVAERLARVEERQLGNMSTLGNIENKIDKVDEKVGIQNGRVRKLEDFNNRQVGIIIAVVTISNFLGAVLIKVIFK